MRNSVLFPCVLGAYTCVFIEVWKHNLMKLKFLENFQSSAHSCVKIELITKQRVVKSCHQLLSTTYSKKRKCAKNLPFEYSIIITDSSITYNIWKWISLSWISLLLERNLNFLTWYTQSVFMRNGPIMNTGEIWAFSTYLILTFEDPL